jgi:phenylalanyl-tRNA synthetase beta chain
MERAVNLSLRYLRSHVPDLPESAEEIAARLREHDVEVLRVAPLAELLKAVVVARVDSVTQHPNADRLRICAVDDGSGTPLQIVTGAANVAAGAFYPLFRSGTVLPNGTKIKRGKLRGEVSEGMLGSADELELGGDHDGLFTLTGELVPGTPLPDAMPVEGTVFILPSSADPGAIVRHLTGQPEPDAPPAS